MNKNICKNCKYWNKTKPLVIFNVEIICAICEKSDIVTYIENTCPDFIIKEG
jgi:hypothetical protein